MWREVAAIRTGASTAPAIMTATDNAANTPITRPKTSAGTIRASGGLGNHLARHQAGAADHRHAECHDETVDGGVRELGGADERAGGHDDDRDSAAHGESPIDDRAQQATDACRGEQRAVAAGTEAEHTFGVHDELHGLRAIRELHHGHDEEERYDEGSCARRSESVHDLRDSAVELTDADRRAAAPHRGDQHGRNGEGARVDGEGRGCRGRREQEGAEGRTDDDSEILHRVEERVRRAEARLTDQAREQCHGRGALGRARRGGEGGEGDHECHGCVEPDHCRQDEHLQAPKNVADEQDRAAVVAVGYCPTNRTEQRIREEPADGRRPDPPRRARSAVDVAQERSVVEPVAELRHGARGDERAGVANREYAAICRPSLSGTQDAET